MIDALLESVWCVGVKVSERANAEGGDSGSGSAGSQNPPVGDIPQIPHLGE